MRKVEEEACGCSKVGDVKDCRARKRQEVDRYGNECTPVSTPIGELLKNIEAIEIINVNLEPIYTFFCRCTFEISCPTIYI